MGLGWARGWAWSREVGHQLNRGGRLFAEVQLERGQVGPLLGLLAGGVRGSIAAVFGLRLLGLRNQKGVACTALENRPAGQFWCSTRASCNPED